MSAAENLEPPRFRAGDLVRACQEGRLKPAGDRLLVRAVLLRDAFSADLTSGIDVDAREAYVWIVDAVGPDAKEYACGDVVLHNSVAGDAVDWTDSTCRYWLVRQADVIGTVEP